MLERERSFFTAGVLLAAWIAGGLARAQNYTITDLGSLEGPSGTSVAYGVNDAGQVVGQSSVSGGDVRPFLWDAGNGMQDLGSLGGHMGWATDVDSQGRVVGQSDYTPSAFQSHAFAWSGSILTDLGTLVNQPGDVSGASARNELSTIVGWSQSLSGDIHGFRLVGSTWTDLGVLTGGTQSRALAVNDGGVIAGWSKLTGNGGYEHPVRWDAANQIQDLGVFPSGPVGQGQATGVNASGQVTGWSTIQMVFLDVHAFRWDSTNGLQDLGVWEPNADSWGFAINDAGDVVGRGTTTGNNLTAMLWKGMACIDLSTALPFGNGWTFQAAEDISTGGRIVGEGYVGGNLHAFLLEPAPCPTWVLPVDATVGGSLQWSFSSPCHPGLTGVVFPSLTGGTGPLRLPGGITIQISVDTFLILMLSVPAVSVAPLDGQGQGTTAALPLPSSPGLVGRHVWAAGGILSGAVFVAGSPTLSVTLQ